MRSRARSGARRPEGARSTRPSASTSHTREPMSATALTLRSVRRRHRRFWWVRECCTACTTAGTRHARTRSTYPGPMSTRKSSRRVAGPGHAMRAAGTAAVRQLRGQDSLAGRLPAGWVPARRFNTFAVAVPPRVWSSSGAPMWHGLLAIAATLMPRCNLQDDVVVVDCTHPSLPTLSHHKASCPPPPSRHSSCRPPATSAAAPARAGASDACDARAAGVPGWHGCLGPPAAWQGAARCSAQ
jgi:hypothetical protein